MIVTALRKTRIDVGQTDQDSRLWKSCSGHYARRPARVASTGMLHERKPIVPGDAAIGTIFQR
jgi:hypothetical protein